MVDVSGSKNEDNNESDVDPPRKLGADSSEVGLFFEPEPIPTKPEDREEGDKNEDDKNPRFTF
ncbi:hypothetical protein PVK06_044735 [Gossypium arboreum]|uniref:Uncharacterized protein n=1 Tax=Gossypium arboreum TaxID=29729 RepID=A0ABR0MS94_GOSAR|nr:hypothetical protein PVK06_044735 [Gossypium arboreum]